MYAQTSVRSMKVGMCIAALMYSSSYSLQKSFYIFLVK